MKRARLVERLLRSGLIANSLALLLRLLLVAACVLGLAMGNAITVAGRTGGFPEPSRDGLRLIAGDELTAQDGFRFVSWADTRGETVDLAPLSIQAALLNPTFTIYEGDLELAGFTLSGMNAWKDAMNGYSSNGMFDITLPVRGNHDAEDTAGWQSYYDMHSTAQSLGATNYVALDEDLTYSFDYGNSHFIGVDMLGGAERLSSEQVSWIDNDLSAAEARGLTHAFVYFHGPIYCVDGHSTCTTRICPLDPIVVNLIEVFNSHPIVSATFHGHEHTNAYVHIDDTRIPEVTHPFEQFITGSAGAGPSDCIPERTDYCMPSNGFVTVDVSGDVFTVDFYEVGVSSAVRSMTFSKSGNRAPLVEAGPDRTVTLPGTALLDGTVSDDGLPNPPGTVEALWSQVSGPGSVVFADATAVDTTASFGEAGTYVLRLTAADGELTISDEVTITVNPSSLVTVEERVSASYDDGEERLSGGISLTSTDLELINDASYGDQQVGMRFTGMEIPQGATIVKAYVQFKVDETKNIEPVELTIQGEATDNALTFTYESGNISDRATTAAAVPWLPNPWTTVGEAGPDQQTPDLAAVLQEIVDRPSWTSGNSLVIFITGTGRRVAESYNGDPAGAPLLHVEYDTGPPNNPPVVAITAPADGSTLHQGENILFTGTADDVEDGDLAAGLAWVSSQDGAIGNGAFFTRSDLSMGVHTITTSVTDSGGLESSDQISIMVTSPSGNLPPSVSAGPDQTIGFYNDAILDGSVVDDGLPDPPGLVSTTWSQVSGPGTVTFAGASLVDTTASFSAAGDYVLELTADDGELAASDQVTVTVYPASTIRVPEDQPTIQAGIDAAQDGDRVLVSPGTYYEALTLDGKTITLASLFDTTQDPAFIDQTIIDGGGSAAVITVRSSVGPETKVAGFTIQNGADGITAYASLHILHNRFLDNVDAIDYESGGGICRDNHFENNNDDAVDLDGSTGVVIENNTIVNNGDDGIEIRLHEYSGPTLSIIVRGNIISGNDEDGIQLVDYPDVSNRFFLIERNLIEANAMAGLGLMDNGVTTEDYRAASIPERIHLFNNIFIGNDHGLSGGDDLIALNNLFVNSIQIAMKGMDGESVAAYNLFWNNGTDHQSSNVDLGTTLFADPLLDAEHHLLPGSPAIDAGTAHFDWQGETVLDLPSSAYHGVAPDLGWFESDFGPSNDPPVANDDSASTLEDTPVTIDVAANDSDPDGSLDLGSTNTGCTGCAGPAHGSLVNNGDGSLEYTPDPDYYGVDSFVYEICDTLGACDTARVGVTVIAVNDPPVANDDVTSTPEDTPVAIDVAANDGDPDGNLDPATANTGCTGCAGPAHGSLVNNGDGSFEYTPNGGFAGSDSFVYEICDSLGACDTARVDVTVTAVNDPPVAVDDSASTPEDTPVTIDVAANDGDLDGNLDAATANSRCANGSTGCDGAVNGTLADNGDGTITYTPDPDFDGVDSFVYEICDSLGACDTARVGVTVVAVNDPPVANDDSASTLEDTPVAIDVAANDGDPDGNLDPATANTGCTGCAGPAHGSLVNNGDGSFEYTPNGGFAGSDSFVYEICDSLGACDTATVSITVTAVNDPPVANDDSASTLEDTPMTIDVAANDSDPDGSLDLGSTNTGCTGCAGPAHGSLVNNGDGSLEYTPDPDYNGVDSFVYEICDTLGACDTARVDVTITAVNDPPVANDDSASTLEDTPVTIDVAANDSDPDGSLDLGSTNTGCAGCAGPAHGSLVNNGDGSFEYTPNGGFAGSDSFAYGICDTLGACDTAAVSITVNPSAPLTVEARVSASYDDGEERLSGGISLTSTDLELVNDASYGDQQVGMRFNGMEIPQGATIVKAYVQFKVDETKSIEPVELTIQGEAADNALTFTYESGNISDRATTAAAVSWLPVPWLTVGEAGPDQQTPDLAAVLQEIVDRPNWTSGNSLVIFITGTGRRVAESYNGDPAGAPLLHVEYHAGLPNDPPVANDDSASTLEDTPVTIDVAANDSDPDGSLDLGSTNMGCTGCAGPAHGSLVNNGDGSLEYTPDPDYNGVDSFVYEICDTLGACDTATVGITVMAVNDPPVANDDSASTLEDTAVTIDVAANDSDPDGNLDPATANTGCTGCAGPAYGSLVNNGDGSFEYTPNGGFAGSDSFVYEICDSLGACDTARVDVTVTAVNDPPVANDDSASTLEDTPVTIDVAANDSDPDGNLDTATTNTGCADCAGPAHGSLVNNGDGSLKYTPDPDYNGVDSFVYEICDSLGACDTARVNLTVTAVNDPPVANDDSASTLEDTAVTIDVAANDSDPDGSLDLGSTNTGCTGCAGPAHGSLVNNGDGSFEYTPNGGFAGSDSFAYEICDSLGACDTAAVSITVNPSAPVTIEVRVGASSDDAEESASGSMSLGNRDLQLVYYKDNQTVGARFTGLWIPQGATIVKAYVQFKVDEKKNLDPVVLTVEGEAVDNAATFATSSGNVSSRPRTAAAVTWSPVPWLTVGETGPDQQTPDLAAVIQEIVDRPGWTSGNSLVIIITGTGKRVAESYDGDQAGAPLLHVEYHDPGS